MEVQEEPEEPEEPEERLDDLTLEVFWDTIPQQEL